MILCEYTPFGHTSAGGQPVLTNWRVPLVQTTQTHRPPSSSKNSPAQLREAHRLPPSHPSYPVVSASDTTSHNVAITPRALPAGPLQSWVPEVRPKLLANAGPPSHRTGDTPPTSLSARRTPEAKKTQNIPIRTNNSSSSTTATTPRMVPLFVTSRLARLSRELSRPPWVRTAATRSSSITYRR
jgi:hypothetical protein